MKQRIRLTEGDLHRIIRESVNEILMMEWDEPSYDELDDSPDETVSGEYDMIEEFLDILYENIGQNMEKELEDLFYEMDINGVFTIEYTLATEPWSNSTSVLYMTDFDEIMGKVSEYVTDEQLLPYVEQALRQAYDMIDEDDLINNTDFSGMPEYDWASDTSNYPPREV